MAVLVGGLRRRKGAVRTKRMAARGSRQATSAWPRFSVSRTPRAALLLESWIGGHPPASLLIAIVIILAYEFIAFGPNVRVWDPLFVSGALVLVAGLEVALQLPARMREMLTRLQRRGALPLEEAATEQLVDGLEARAELIGQNIGVLGAVIMLGAFLIVYGLGVRTRVFILAVAIGGGYFAGRALGRGIAYGSLGSVLQARGLPLMPQPAHLDGAAGLKPVGDFYFFQAMIVAIPAMFLAAWWLAIPILNRYQRWRGTYLVLLGVCVLVEVLAFFSPMIAFHKRMKTRKAELLLDADALSQEVAELQARLVSAHDETERTALKEELQTKIDRYHAIEGMPTWPVDARIRRRFTINNAVLIAPMVVKGISEFDSFRQTMSR